MDAGAVGISPVRCDLGPVGGCRAPLTPLVSEIGLVPFLLWFIELWKPFCDDFAASRLEASFLFASSTSFARFSKANFSRWAFDKNLGYRKGSTLVWLEELLE